MKIQFAILVVSMASWPSGKARVCKILIHGFKSRRRLQITHSEINFGVSNLEASTGFEPVNKDFADPRLTTWPRRHGNNKDCKLDFHQSAILY